jgi:hypothetical protein
MPEIVPKYHRRSRRIGISQPVKLVPSVARGESFEEVATTSNVSREGFYFVTKREHYTEGMRLFVTLPYHAPGDHRNREYLAQVTRLEWFDDGQRGVGVQLLSQARG